MIDLAGIPRTPRFDDVDAARFRAEIQPLQRPALLPGLIAQWPAVQAAAQSDEALCDLLRDFGNASEIEACFAQPAINGRFFYDPALTGLNFERRSLSVAELLDFLLTIKSLAEPPGCYAGAVRMKTSLPGFLERHPSPLIDTEVAQLNSVWIGNRTRIAAHWDLPQNLICAVGGRRRYILFPPDQLANLYCGPIDFTPAGQPVSLVDFAAPDLQRFPRFAEAMRHAEVAELEPGDALYLPSLWWHHAESLDPVGVMVNYWWREEPAYMGSPRITLLHALLSIRDLPHTERQAWRLFFDHYVFGDGIEEAVEHIPVAARGVLGEHDETLAANLRNHVARALIG